MSNTNNNSINNLEKARNELLQILKLLKEIYARSIQYKYSDIINDEDKITIKHLFESEIHKLKDEIDNLTLTIDFVYSQLNYAKTMLQRAIQKNDKNSISHYNKQIFYLIETIERLYNSYAKINELIQKYYTMITDYENRLIDNINKTFRSLLYKNDTKTDANVVFEIYQQLEDLIKQQQNSNENNKSSSDDLFSDEYKL